MSNPKAYSYLRFSTPEQMGGDSFRRQHQLALDYCLAHGLTLDTEVTYSDLGVSAFRGKNAEAGRLAEFLEAVRLGIVAPGSFLLVESLDRISRQGARKALGILESICDQGINVVTLCDGRTYTSAALDSDPTALLMSLLIFIRANEESEMKSKRIKAAWATKRAKARGKDEKMTAIGPGWLWLDKGTDTWLVIPERAKQVRRMFLDAAKGFSAHEIAGALNNEGVPCFGDGAKWHASYVIRILFGYRAVLGTCVPRVLEVVNGKKRWRELDPIENYFPPVVSPELYERAQAFREEATRAVAAGVKQKNIFAGLVRCALCGETMTVQTKGRRYFVCRNARRGRGCKYAALRYDMIEGAFLGAVPQMLDEARSHNITSHADAFAAERAEELARLLKATGLDRPAAHDAVRAVFSGLALDASTGEATLGWRHGGTSQFKFARRERERLS